MAAENSGLPS